MSRDETREPHASGDDTGTTDEREAVDDSEDSPEENRMPKIDCRVSAALRDAVEATAEERGLPSRSAGIREALREWVDASGGDDRDGGLDRR